MNPTSESIVTKKIVFPKAYDVEIQSIELKTALADNQVLVRNQYSLISPGTELAFYTDSHAARDTWAKLPISPGYASVGEVVAVGQAVNAVSPGDHVLAHCSHASYALLGYTPDRIIRIPGGLSPKKALFARMAGISMSSLIHSRIQPGMHVAIIGMGLVGNLACQLYSIQGAHPLGIDVIAQRLDIAQQCRIDRTILSGESVNLTDRVKALTGGFEPDIVVEATGNPQLINVALALVRCHGQVILLGSPRGRAEIDVYTLIHAKGVSLVGAHTNIKGMDGLPSNLETTKYVFDLIDKGTLHVEPLLSHVVPYARAKDAYDMLLNGKENAMGVILDWESS